MAGNVLIDKLDNNKTYSMHELYKIFETVDPDMSKSTFQWTLYGLRQNGLIHRVGYDTYTINDTKNGSTYRPIYSDMTMSIIKFLKSRFDELSFVAFESVQLNEFLNHQIAQNTVYIQVEKDISTYVFDVLREKFKYNILYKPNEKEFLKYWMENTIVVLDLISQAPLSKEFPHEMTGEKFLVDILADKSISAIFSPAELPLIFDNFKERYLIDKHRLNRYAGRRGKTKEIKKYMGEM